jgi:hypothetical protein
MSDRIRELLIRNLQEVFGEGDADRRRVTIEELYTDDCILDAPLGVFVGRDALDSSRETCARLILISSIRHTASRRRSTTPAVCRGAPVRAERRRIILA